MTRQADEAVGEGVKKVVAELYKSLIKRELPISIAIVVIEEVAREIAEEIASALPKPKTLRTLTFEEEGFELTSLEELLSHVGEGKLREAVMVFDAPDVRVHLMVDGFDRMPRHNSISDLLNLSPKLEYLAVFENSNGYVVHVKEINFINNIKVYVNPLKKLTLKKFFALLDVVEQ